MPTRVPKPLTAAAPQDRPGARNARSGGKSQEESRGFAGFLFGQLPFRVSRVLAGVGIGGPVGSGKTALMDHLCKRMRDRFEVVAITNDIYTREDAEFLTRSGALPPERIRGVETGGVHAQAVEMFDGHGEALRERRVTEVGQPGLLGGVGQHLGGVQRHVTSPHSASNSFSAATTFAADAAE